MIASLGDAKCIANRKVEQRRRVQLNLVWIRAARRPDGYRVADAVVPPRCECDDALREGSRWTQRVEVRRWAEGARVNERSD